MAGKIYHVRFDDDLVERIERFTEEKKLANESLAIRRLVTRGLDVSANDSFDLARSLSTLASASQQTADRVGALESDIAQMTSILPDIKGVIDQLGERSDALQPQVRPFLLILCEVLMACRILAEKMDPENYNSLDKYTLRALENYQTRVREHPGGDAYTAPSPPATKKA